MYDVNYFIKKFEAIPEDKWCDLVLHSDGRNCALGHCGVKKLKNNGFFYDEQVEAICLTELFMPLYKNRNANCCVVGDVNDGYNLKYEQPTPKQRILAALYDIKATQEPKVKEVIRYVAVDAEIRTLVKEPALS